MYSDYTGGYLTMFVDANPLLKHNDRSYIAGNVLLNPTLFKTYDAHVRKYVSTFVQFFFWI